MRTNNHLLFLSILLFSAFMTSCSTFNRMAISTSSNLMFEASKDMETESNFEITKAALPPNLKLIEGLLSQDPKNRELLLTLTKGYTALAYIVNETDMLEEEWSGKKTEENKKQALKNYTRAFHYGLRYLSTKSIQEADVFSNTQNSLDKNLSNNDLDLETVFFTAQAFGGMINLQKDNMAMMAQLSIVKNMFDWVCVRKPEINFGACDVFYGAYEAGRPKMLGGNPDKGKEYFLKAIQRHPHNWLIRTSFAQFYLIPMSDEDGFSAEMKNLEKLNQSFEAYNIYSKNAEIPEWSKESRLRAYQALAMKRYELLLKYKKQLF